MNILFYVEPHPLRDSFSSHSQPYRTFLNICRQIKLEANIDAFDDVDVRVFSNHVLQEIKFSENLDMWPLILTPTTEEQIAIEKMATLWLPNGVQDWLQLCTNPDAAITKFYIQILDRIKRNSFDFDVIVSWGQNQAIKTFAQDNNVQTVYIELASMRPPFPRALLIDPVGVNGAASSRFIDISDVDAVFKNASVHTLFNAINDEFHTTKQNSNLFTSKFHPTALPFFELSGKTALIPLQLADDANLLLYSDYQSIEEFTDTCLDLLIAHGSSVIIKPHPHARLRGGYVEHAQNAVLRKYGNNTRVQVLDGEVPEHEYLSLLSAVDLIVTNNSSVGFEGLLCGTQCVTMGTSCYSLVDGLPTLLEYLNSDLLIQKRYQYKAALMTTFLLSFMFPLERRLAHELVARIRLWKTVQPPPFGNAKTWIEKNLNQLGWSTWHNSEIMREHFGHSFTPPISSSTDMSEDNLHA